MKCPACHLISPREAERCDCGHDFTSKPNEGDAPATVPGASADRRGTSARQRIAANVVLVAGLLEMGLGGLTARFGGRKDQEIGAFCFLLGIIVAVIGAAIRISCISDSPRHQTASATRARKPASVVLMLASLGLALVSFFALFPNEYTSFVTTSEQRELAQKAAGQAAACKDLWKKASRPFSLTGKALVWDLSGNSRHPAQKFLPSGLQFSKGEGPVTVFLVTGKESFQIGTYSVSEAPANEMFLDVCMVEFRDRGASGTAVAVKRVEGLSPRHSRPVMSSPEYGDPTPALAWWISSVWGAELLDAAQNGDAAMAKAALKRNPDLVFSTDPEGRTPLHLALLMGQVGLAELLLAAGGDANAQDKHGTTPLHLAATECGASGARVPGYRHVVESLLAHRARVNARDNSGTTPLFGVSKKEMAELLLAHGADVNVKGNDGVTPLHQAVMRDGATAKEVAESLLSHGAEVNAKEHLGTTPLHWAVHKGQKEVVELLLAHGADANVKDDYGHAPLQGVKGREDIAEVLRKHGGRE